jgi:hypothetical protein
MKFSIWTFNSKEINQIKSLIQDWAAGRLMPLDCRKEATKNVREYADSRGLIIKGDDKRLEYYPENFKPTRWYVNNIPGCSQFNLIYDIPVKLLWEMIKPILQFHEGWKVGTGIGYSITRHKQWLNLNILPSSNKDFSDYDLKQMILILDILATHQYIIFQRSGSIWNIAILKES